MHLLRDIPALAPFRAGVFVPTMGALHEGHLALIRAAAERARAERDRAGRACPVIVSIFVNPTQFNDPRDYARYPRTLERDAAACEQAGADALFAPSAAAIYARDESGRVLAPKPREEDLPEVARLPRLEDARRPGHFAGVYQVVKRLFELVRPAAAVFGEKDWQQLQLVRALVARERMPIEIVGRPTVREADGLAMSSRNTQLDPAARRQAAMLWRALEAARARRDPGEAERAGARTLLEAPIEPEYLAVRDAETLGPPDARSLRPARVLVAARVGGVRLIDNAPWPA